MSPIRTQVRRRCRDGHIEMPISQYDLAFTLPLAGKTRWFSLEFCVLPGRNVERTHEHGGCPTMAVWVV